MSIAVTETEKGHYIVILNRPEIVWLDIIAGRLICSEPAAVSIVFGQGFIELMSKFGEPVVTPETKGG